MAETRSPLTELHERAGAQFEQVGESKVPAAFSNPDAEHAAMHRVAGILDLCHTPRFKFEGIQRVEALDHLCTIDVAALKPNTARACYLCNESGSAIDRVVVLKTDQYILLQGTSTDRAALQHWIEEQAKDFDIECVDSSTSQGCIEVRGPMARTILEAVVLDGTLPSLAGEAAICSVGQARCLVLRRGYGSIESYLLHTGAFFIQQLWERLIMTGQNMGAHPIGRRAQEIMRIEHGFPGFGTEIDADATPLELGVANLVDFSKREHLGREALMRHSSAEFLRKMVALRFDAPTPPERGAWIEFDSMPIGRVTSSAVLATQRRCAALGFVDVLKSAKNTVLQARTRSQVIAGRVVEAAIEATSAAPAVDPVG